MMSNIYSQKRFNNPALSERLGHGSVAMTLDIYAHASPGLQQAAAHGFDKVLEVIGYGAEIVEMSRV